MCPLCPRTRPVLFSCFNPPQMLFLLPELAFPTSPCGGVCSSSRPCLKHHFWRGLHAHPCWGVLTSILELVVVSHYVLSVLPALEWRSPFIYSAHPGSNRSSVMEEILIKWMNILEEIGQKINYSQDLLSDLLQENSSLFKIRNTLFRTTITSRCKTRAKNIFIDVGTDVTKPLFKRVTLLAQF